jgi:hypothetical protein
MTTPTPPEGYVIVANGQVAQETVFLLDRQKQTRAWWSNRLDNVLVYREKRVADFKAASLKHNNPRVVTLAEAQRIAREQADVALRERGSADADWGVRA